MPLTIVCRYAMPALTQKDLVSIYRFINAVLEKCLVSIYRFINAVLADYRFINAVLAALQGTAC